METRRILSDANKLPRGANRTIYYEGII
jgi:hypothetical protein